MNSIRKEIYSFISCLIFFATASCSNQMQPPPPSFFDDDDPSANLQSSEKVPDFYPTPGQVSRPPNSEAPSENSSANAFPPGIFPPSAPDAGANSALAPNPYFSANPAAPAAFAAMPNPMMPPAAEMPKASVANPYFAAPNSMPNSMAAANPDPRQAQLTNPTLDPNLTPFANPPQTSNQPVLNFSNPNPTPISDPSFDPAQRRAPILNQYDLMARRNASLIPPPIQIPQPQPKIDETPLTENNCAIDESTFNAILLRVKKKTPKAIEELVDCLKMNRKLMLRVAIIDPSQFQYASDILKEDESFVRRIIEINPEVLKFASEKLRGDRFFMERASYLNRDSLQFADAKLLDNRVFMKNMINIDSRNYIFASDRIKEMSELAEIAFKDDGLLLESAPQNVKKNKKLVKIAAQSNADALKFAADELREDKDLKKLSAKKSSIKSEKSLKKFLHENYINSSNKKNLGYVIDNRMKHFNDNAIVDRQYISKWQRSYDRNNDEMRLISADSRNYPVLWKEDFKKFPLLVKKIERFFLNHNVAQNTIDALSTTYFWKVKKNPQTVVFNLYLLRDSKDSDLGAKFDDITSLTAVAQKQGENWSLSVAQVIFDNEVKMDVAFESGHKKYELWDLYVTDSSDKNPKIIFKVEDKFSEYFEIFEEQNNGKYRMTYRVDSLKEADSYQEDEEEERSGDDSY